MRSEKEILNALEIIKETCIENNGKCSVCVLRNAANDCGIIVDSYDNTYEKPREWTLRDDNIPRLMLG